MLHCLHRFADDEGLGYTDLSSDLQPRTYRREHGRLVEVVLEAQIMKKAVKKEDKKKAIASSLYVWDARGSQTQKSWIYVPM